jgi:hypothetical protein
MKTHTLLIAVAAVSLSALPAMAQTGQTGRTPESGQTDTASVAAGQSRGSRNETVTVTGCLKLGGNGAESGSTGSASSRGASGAADNRSRADSGYMLTNARVRSGSGGDTGGSRASSGTRGAVYSVTGLSNAELQSHVNQQVQVTGRIESDRDSTGSSAAAGTPGSTGGNPSSRSATIDHAPRLHATALQMISSTCSGGTD